MEVINLNLIPNGTNPVVHVKQYDEGREFGFNLFNGTNVLTLDGTEDITCVVKKPDGNIVSVAVPNTSSNNVVVTTTLQMTACSGNSVGVLNISKGGVNLYTLNFILYCERNPLENGIESESSIHDLQAQIADAVADQYDSNNVIFDNTGTAGHGIGYAVTSEGILTMVNGAIALIPVKLSDLSDVNINNPQANQALIFDLTDPDNPVIKNGTVSTVGNLDDLSDVDTTGKAEGDSLRYIGGEWKAKPTTVEMTKAEYDAIVDFTPYANTHIVITDAPNLNPTASDIEYQSGVTVADMLNVETGIFTPSANVSVLRSMLVKIGNLKILSVVFQRTGVANTLGTVSSGFEATSNYDFIATDDSGSGTRLRINSDDTVSFSLTPNPNIYYAFTLAYT